MTCTAPAPSEFAPIELGTAGRCRGQLLVNWAENLRRRFGDHAPSAVRARMGEISATLPDAPSARAWLPVDAQLRLADVIYAHFYAGDLEAMYRDAYADSLTALPRGTRFALRGLGLKRLIQRAPGLHRKLYDVGDLEVEIGRKSATLSFYDAELFGHPTWQRLQTFAVRMLFDMVGKPAAWDLSASGRDHFELSLVW